MEDEILKEIDGLLTEGISYDPEEPGINACWARLFRGAQGPAVATPAEPGITTTAVSTTYQPPPTPPAHRPVQESSA